MLADRETAPAFHRMEISPDGAERLVLRFSGADIAVAPADGADLGIEFELRGAEADLSGWQPSVRRIEGILVIGEDSGPVKVAEIRDWTKSKEYRDKNFAREALTVNPAKACQPLGAVFAAAGFDGTMSFVHGLPSKVTGLPARSYTGSFAPASSFTASNSSAQSRTSADCCSRAAIFSASVTVAYGLLSAFGCSARIR